MHIGLIGGIGPAATEFYYRGLIHANSMLPEALELTIAHADMAALRANLATGNAQQQASLFCHHLQQLKDAGAQVAAVTSIAGHFCIGELESISPLPLVNALTALGSELRARKLERVGLLGSRAAMETRLYHSVAGLEILVPRAAELAEVGEQYFAMAASQRATAAQRELFIRAGASLCSEQGAQAVVLGGTDLFLAFQDSDPGFELIDSAAVHIQALAHSAMQK